MGRGECVPYARYGESPDGVAATLEQSRAQTVARRADPRRSAVGDARRAPRAMRSIARSGISRPSAPDDRCYELAGLTAAAAADHRLHDLARHARCDGQSGHGTPARDRLLKIKLGTEGDPERIAAIRAAVPGAELIVDANEGWNPDNLADNLAACAQAGVTLVEQPLPAGADEPLRTIAAPGSGLCRRKRA